MRGIPARPSPDTSAPFPSRACPRSDPLGVSILHGPSAFNSHPPPTPKSLVTFFRRPPPAAALAEAPAKMAASPQTQQPPSVFPKSHVGFDSITNQIEKKLLKRGFQFNIICVGTSRRSCRLRVRIADCVAPQARRVWANPP